MLPVWRARSERRVSGRVDCAVTRPRGLWGGSTAGAAKEAPIPPFLKQQQNVLLFAWGGKLKVFTIAAGDEPGGPVYPSASWFPGTAPKRQLLNFLTFLNHLPCPLLFFFFGLLQKEKQTEQAGVPKSSETGDAVALTRSQQRSPGGSPAPPPEGESWELSRGTEDWPSSGQETFLWFPPTGRAPQAPAESPLREAQCRQRERIAVPTNPRHLTSQKSPSNPWGIFHTPHGAISTSPQRLWSPVLLKNVSHCVSAGVRSAHGRSSQQTLCCCSQCESSALLLLDNERLSLTFKQH